MTALEGGGDSKRNPYYQGIVDWPKAGRFDYDWDGTVAVSYTHLDRGVSKREIYKALL